MNLAWFVLTISPAVTITPSLCPASFFFFPSLSCVCLSQMSKQRHSSNHVYRGCKGRAEFHLVMIFCRAGFPSLKFWCGMLLLWSERICHVCCCMGCTGTTNCVEWWPSWLASSRNLIPKTPPHRDDRDSFREAVSFSSVSFCMWERSLRFCGKSQYC